MALNGAIAVVTGAARGLGRKIAEAFVARGARVAIVDILEDQLQRTAAEMKEAGGTVLPVVTDITVASQVDAMAEKIQNELGPVAVLVNNAGTFSVIGPVWEVEPDKWFRDVRVNLYGSFLVCRAIVKGMVARKRGYVINVVSSGGVGDPHPYSTSYASSKTGLMRLTEGLAKEAQEHGVKGETPNKFGLPTLRIGSNDFLLALRLLPVRYGPGRVDVHYTRTDDQVFEDSTHSFSAIV